MGMDYQYAGSASYPRFDREICDIVNIFGGIKTEHLKERESTENERPLGYWFGFLSSDNSNEAKFAFPEGTNELLVNWFNNLYKDYSAEDTKIIWDLISQHPEIEQISGQIWHELKTLVIFEEGWSIC